MPLKTWLKEQDNKMKINGVIFSGGCSNVTVGDRVIPANKVCKNIKGDVNDKFS